MTIRSDLLEVSSHDGPGYLPVVDSGAWRVALMNRSDKCTPGAVASMERHNETDEVFVLLHGRAILFVGEAGEGDTAVERIDRCRMELGKAYNVRRAAWHACALSRDAKVLIVENRDTTEANSDCVRLDDAQRAEIARESADLDR